MRTANAPEHPEKQELPAKHRENVQVDARPPERHPPGWRTQERETFEWIDPAMVCNPHGTQIVLGKLSGRAGFAARAHVLGIELTAARLEAAFARFQAIADRKREPDDGDVRAACASD